MSVKVGLEELEQYWDLVDAVRELADHIENRPSEVKGTALGMIELLAEKVARIDAYAIKEED